MATDEVKKDKAKIKVFGVGGGGNSVLMRMSENQNLDIDLVAINTESRILERAAATKKIKCIQIGEKLTRGRGTGGHVEVGEQAAKDAKRQIEEAMSGSDLIFITAGMGGGTGTGAAPVVAEIARNLNILSIGVVTIPFSFEGMRKKRTAMAGVQQMQADMDALIAVENDNLLKLPENRRMSLKQGFQCADQVLMQAIDCITELIMTTGVINVDFADLTTVLRQSGSSDALLGIGNSKHSAVEAVRLAVTNPLTEQSLLGARGVIVNLTGDANLPLFDVYEAMNYITENTDPNVNIILGTVTDDSMAGGVKATIIATDFVNSRALKKARTEETPQQAKTVEAPVRPARTELNPPHFMNRQEAQAAPQHPAEPKPAEKPQNNGWSIPDFFNHK